jgi:streptomycin 3"-adenylyltransferase
MGMLLRDCLGGDIAVVLHGSLALGEFWPGQSDVDVLVFVDGPLTRDQAQGLATGFLAVSGQPAPIEVSVLERRVLAAWVHPAPYLFHYSEAWRTRMTQMLTDPATDWLAPRTDPDLTVHVVVARQAGIVLHGSVVWPVPTRADALAAVWYDIATAEADVVDNPVYVILNLCRTIRWLEHGEVLSKSAGGWALLPELTGDTRAVVAAVLALRADAQQDALPADALQRGARELLARVSGIRGAVRQHNPLDVGQDL